MMKVYEGWVVRGLAPDRCRIGLSELGPERDEARMMRAMGWETANIHLGSFSRADLEKRLKALDRDERWFAAATERMIANTCSDHAAWAEHHPGKKNATESA